MSQKEKERWLSVLQKNGYRLTTPRLSLVGLLAEGDHVYTAPQLLELAQVRHPELGLATVYRTLETLEALGLVQRVHDAHGCHSYLAKPSQPQPIAVCEQCGSAEAIESALLDSLLTEVRRASNFAVQSHSLQLSGLCRACQ